MASKSKRRGRVFRASCILAALIIAGSSFAWFTSKDEVTNRLTANADYGVSIVESFTPPKNWIPGQEINKDVYAVNTGNIAAFVKESIAGKLTYTYEKRTATAPTAAENSKTDSDYVKLTDTAKTAIDGATTEEAGGFLAWTNATKVVDGKTVPAVEPGPVKSARVVDYKESTDEDPDTEVHGTVTSRWEPDATGVYIFRRSYVPAVEDDPNTTTDETEASYFTYAGYYYVQNEGSNKAGDGEYYKIVIGNDTFRSNNDNENGTTIPYTMENGTRHFEFDISAAQSDLGANVEVDKDGIIKGDVLVQYVKEVTLTDKTVNLTYHGSNSDDPAYLTAWYTAGDTEESADYTNKMKALSDAEKALQDAYEALLSAQGDAASKEVTYENALGAYNTAKSRYDQALADWTYATALSTISTTLINAADTRATVEKEKDDAKSYMDQALDVLKERAKEMLGTPSEDTVSASTAANKDKVFEDLLAFSTKTDISYDSIFKSGTTSLEDTINDTAEAASNGNSPNKELMTQAQKYMQAMSDKWSEIVTASAALKTALGNFDKLNSYRTDGIDDAEQAEKYLEALYIADDEVVDAIEKLETLLTEYKALYTQITVNAAGYGESTLTSLVNNVATTFGTNLAAWSGRLTSMKNSVTKGLDDSTLTAKVGTADFILGDAGIDLLVQDYVAKYNTYLDYQTNKIPAADSAWMEAVGKYNTDAQKAKDDYVAAIKTEQKKVDENDNVAKNSYEGLTTDGETALSTSANPSDESHWYLTDNGNTLVANYSVERHVGTGAQKGDPTLKAKDGSNDYDGDLATLWQTIGDSSSVGVDADNYKLSDSSNTGSTKESLYTPGSYNSSTNVFTASTYTKAVNAVATENTKFKSLVAPNGVVKTLGDLVGDTADLTTGKTTAEDNYKKALEDLKAANGAYTKADVAKTNAETAAGKAAQDDESSIEIIIYLAEEATKLDWTSALADGETAEVADFYYNYILGAGETSSKLVDSVKLSESVGANDYKSLVFDLNVGLESAQITYADDQRTITSTAVDSNDSFAKKVAKDNGVDKIDQETLRVTWDATDPLAGATTTYRVGLNLVTPIELETTKDVVFNEGEENEETITMKYSIKVGETTYIGANTKNGTTYYEYDTENNTVDTNKSVVLTATTA